MLSLGIRNIYQRSLPPKLLAQFKENLRCLILRVAGLLEIYKFHSSIETNVATMIKIGYYECLVNHNRNRKSDFAKKKKPNNV